MSNWVKHINGGANGAAAPRHSVAVIGAGIGGLTAAYKLAQEGFKVTVFEASKQRLGGRIYTNYDSFSAQGQFCEMGGEWIDSTHHDLIKLAHELKLDVQDISKQRAGEELFYFGGTLYAPKDFIDTTKMSGPFVPLARYIGADRRRAHANPKKAAELDAMPMDRYLKTAQAATKAPDWVIDSIAAAYKGEFGTELSDQSALMLINQIGTGLKTPFSVYGYKQDESMRIKGGNHMLIKALGEKLKETGVEIKPGYKLTKLDYRDDIRKPSVYAEFDHEGRNKTLHFDYVVCSIPFTKLREVKGLSELKDRHLLSENKFKAIHELGYGNIVKIMLGMNGHPWENNPLFDVPANGSFRSDNPYLQNTWITSVGQQGQDSIITILVAGHEAKQPPATIIRECKKAVAELFGQDEDAIFNHRHATHIWPKDQFVRGSYSYYKPGQYTTVRLATGTSEIDGRLGFAGEHTDPELYGYMTGAVHSAIVEAKRIAEHARAHAKAPEPKAAVSTRP